MAFAADDELAALQNIHPAFRDSFVSQPESVVSELPDSVIDLLLLRVDSPTFASLALLNKRWARRSSTNNLYAYHLAQLTFPERPLQKKWDTYAKGSLARLKLEFWRIARQKLFPAYRHRLSIFHLVAPTVLSSVSAPHGDFFSYSFSPSATFLAVYSATRLFVLDLRGLEPYVSRALVTKRRPLAAEISDDGKVLAMLVSELKVTVYTLRDEKPKQSHVFHLDEAAKTLAMAPDGTLLAAGQEKAIELFALSETPGRVPRRVVACDSVSHLAFSLDGKLLLGSHTRSAQASTTIISAPDDMNAGMGEEDDGPSVDMATIWISRPLFPSAYERTTHASFVPGDDGALLAYDEPADSFGILDSQLMSFSHSLLEVPAEYLQPSSLPSVTATGDLAAIPFSRSGIRTIGIADLPNESDAASMAIPQRWTSFDKAVSRVRWQAASWTQQRLFAVSAGRSTHPRLLQLDSDDQGETGSVFVFDFDRHADVSRTNEMIIDLSTIDAEPLAEAENADADAMHAQKRPASRASDRPKNLPLARSVTAARRKQKAKTQTLPVSEMTSPVGRPPTQNGEVGVDGAEDEHLNEVYHPSQPRPQSTLLRAASTIAAHRERAPPRFVGNEERLRTPGDPSEIPDESDADNWVPPPPAYDPAEERQRAPRQQKGSHLPPVPPERSPNRPRLTVSTSNPMLRQHQPALQAQQPAEARKPNKLQRPSPKRVKSAYENARNSLVMSSQSVRRVLSKPPPSRGAGTASTGSSVREEDIDSIPPPVPPKEPLRQSSRQPVQALSRPEQRVQPPTLRVQTTVAQQTLQTNSSQAPPAAIRRRPVSLAVQPQTASPSKDDELDIPKRRTILPRPVSFASSGFLESRPANRRSISLPSSSSLHDIPPLGTAESPTVPSPIQMASLHRRQTSSPRASMNSGTSGPPRAALGAVRAGTNPNSPWASSTMLAPLSENGDDEETPPSNVANGRVVSEPPSTKRNSAGPTRLQEARASLNSRASYQRPVSYSATNAPESAAKANDTTSENRPSTGGSGMGARLATIQSVASAIKERSRSRSTGSGVQRSSSVKKKGGVVNEARKKGKGFFSKWKQNVFGTVGSV